MINKKKRVTDKLPPVVLPSPDLFTNLLTY